MSREYDEGLGASPSPETFGQREQTTFVDEEDSTYISKKSKVITFPQKLDLSSLSRSYKSPSRREKKIKKKPSPIKSYHDSSIPETKKKTDLDQFRKKFDDDVNDYINTSLRSITRNSSVTSDRAPSVSSTSSFEQRSLAVQLERAKKLANGMRQRDNCNVDRYRNYEMNSVFHLSSSDDDTRPPSSQASLAYDFVEHVRQKSSDSISRVSSEEPIRSHKNAATSTEGFLSNTFLADLYRDRNTDPDRTLVQIDPDNRSIVDEVFEDYRRKNVQETPILRSERDTSGICGSDGGIIEAARNASAINEHRVGDPTNLHHSLSMLTVNPKQFRQLAEGAHLNRSLPNLERFVIRPSTRDIYNTPLDIDEICGKGVRKNQKSTERIFGGAEIAKNIHGSSRTTTSSTASRSQNSVATSRRPTTSSSAKVREPSLTRSPSHQLPYCSTAPSDNKNCHSVGAVTQNLLGTVKSLHPDWLPMVRNVVQSSGDVVVAFRDELRKQQLSLELKFARNQRTSEEYDDHRTKLSVLIRVLQKLGELSNGHISKVQQIKLIHTALLSA